jgi:hypothetical protein
MMRKYPKAQRILRDMEDDKELMMWAKEGIETQLRDRPKSSEVAEYVPYGDGTLRLEYRYAGKGTRCGPYWIFRYHAGRKQRTIHIDEKSLEEAKRAVDDAFC